MIFEKATGLSVSQSAALGFLAKVEFDAACANARQHNLLGIHVESIRSAGLAGHGRFVTVRTVVPAGSVVTVA